MTDMDADTSAAKHPTNIFSCITNGCLHMDVKPGSKLKNLLPFALKRFAGNIQQIIWWSFHGATEKTVASAESFKNAYLNICDSSQLNQEEPAIAILFSKIPLVAHDTSQCEGTPAKGFSRSHIISSGSEGKPPSRRCLEHTRKRKRNAVPTMTTLADPSTPALPSTHDHMQAPCDSSNDSGSPVIAAATPSSQCERFAPAVCTVEYAFRADMQQRKKKKNKLKAQNRRKQN